MTDDNIFKFPAKEKVTIEGILDDAKDKLNECIVLGVTKDGEAYYSIYAENPQSVVYLLRALEHVILEMELNGD